MDSFGIADHRVKLKESKKKYKYLDLARELKKTMEYVSNDFTNCRCCSWYSHQRFGKRTRGFENKRSSGDNTNYSIVEIGQNTGKSLGDLRKLVVTHTPLNDHRLTLIERETLKEQESDT